MIKRDGDGGLRSVVPWWVILISVVVGVIAVGVGVCICELNRKWGGGGLAIGGVGVALVVLILTVCCWGGAVGGDDSTDMQPSPCTFLKMETDQYTITPRKV